MLETRPGDNLTWFTFSRPLLGLGQGTMILSNIIFLRYLYIYIYIIGLKGLKYLSVIEKSQDAGPNELRFCYIFFVIH